MARCCAGDFVRVGVFVPSFAVAGWAAWALGTRSNSSDFFCGAGWRSSAGGMGAGRPGDGDAAPGAGVLVPGVAPADTLALS